jgi:hypothetical protein
MCVLCMWLCACVLVFVRVLCAFSAMACLYWYLPVLWLVCISIVPVLWLVLALVDILLFRLFAKSVVELQDYFMYVHGRCDALCVLDQFAMLQEVWS